MIKPDLTIILLKNKKILKNIFIDASMSKLSNITCFKCSKVGYKANTCLSNKFIDKNIKKIWIPKRIIVTNPKRSKLA